MDDRQIIALYEQRDERAIEATREKYGHYCDRIAYNMLHSFEDAEEVTADTWLGAWRAIPPHRPENLAAFLGKITRRAALKKLRSMNTGKRGNGRESASFEELEEIVPDGKHIEDAVEAEFLTDILNDFLKKLPERERIVFLRRYWYGEAVKNIAREFGFTESRVKSMLKRTRDRLRTRLTEEEIVI